MGTVSTHALDTSTYVLVSRTFQPWDHRLLDLLEDYAASSKAPSWHQVRAAVSELRARAVGGGTGNTSWIDEERTLELSGTGRTRDDDECHTDCCQQETHSPFQPLY